MTVKVSGLNKILKNLNKEIQKIEGNTRDGLVKVGLFVKAEAVERAPVEFGTLRGSAFSQVSPNTYRGKPVATIGFTAKYAPYVHEAPMKLKGQPRPGNRGSYWQGGENKFLEKSVKLNIREIVDIIKTEASKSLR